MSREYTIKLSEEEIDKIIEIAKWEISDYLLPDDVVEQLERIIDNLKHAKQKPYTNFDKIKDEMTMADLQNLILNNDYPIQKQYCNEQQDKCKNCNKCIKKWLESEVKEDVQ